MKPRKATTGIVTPSRVPLSRTSSSRTPQMKTTQAKTAPTKTPSATAPPNRTPQTKTPARKTPPSKIPLIRTPPVAETPSKPSTRQGRSQEPQQTLRVPSPNPQTKPRIVFSSEPPPIHRRPPPSPSPARPPPKTTVSNSQKPRRRNARLSSVPPRLFETDKDLTPKEQQVANDRRRSAGCRTRVSVIQRQTGVKKTKSSS
jgi:hypothetical protein